MKHYCNIATGILEQLKIQKDIFVGFGKRD